MGCTAIRTSHNPPAPELLDLCDRWAVLVIAEAFDCWRRAKKPNDYHRLFDDWHGKDLRALVRRDRNHPCVIAWSTGNEIGEQGTPEGAELSAALTKIVHDEDPTRLATAGCNFTQAGYNGFQKTIDVFGYNYKPFEYGKFREHNPEIPIYGSETASTVSSRGEYLFPVSDDKAEGRADFQVSSYDLYAPPWATTPDTEFQGPGPVPVRGRRVRVDRLRLSGRADAVQQRHHQPAKLFRPRRKSPPRQRVGATRQNPGPVAQFVLRHPRPVRLQKGPVLPVPGPVAPRLPHGPHRALTGPGPSAPAKSPPSTSTPPATRPNCS
jgi:hypothetical protein